MRTRNALGLMAAVLVLLAIACGRNENRSEPRTSDMVLAEEIVSLDSAVAGNATPGKPEPHSISSSAAQADNDGKRRMIRTADIRFRVKDVLRSTYAIEDVVRRFDGFVTNTELRSTIDGKQNIPISEDSVMETTRYTVINQLTFRVPNAQLDTTLKSLAAQVDFMDHRTISANDVALQLLRNQLEQARIRKHGARMENAIDDQGRKLKETLPAEDRLLDRQADADDALLANLGMEDRIAYSTVTLDLYQRQSVRNEVLPSTANVTAYTPGFGQRLKASLADGLAVLEGLLLLVVKAWSVLLLALIGFLVWRRMRGRLTAAPR
jgi:Domain of unknown function (DUF4349)